MRTSNLRGPAAAFVVPLLAIALVGCAGDNGGASPATVPPESPSAEPTASPTVSPDTSPTMAPMSPTASPMGGDGHGTFPFGEPAEAGEADRTVEIVGLDSLEWDPPTVEVKLGETITFRVTNDGLIAHDFTLGTAEMQDEHEEEMAGGPMMHEEPNAFVLDPGETREMTWTFTSLGQVLYGCHQPGHYVGGMVGTIAVTE